ncbi:hypothetical protein [Kutzneria kofuensis]|uniref:Uncharacterized protein n=1 Tax=Kutzneria kofuensis TaxID=103725 RepID=A0A7W9KLM1_9PSEU|nr:hypothetical protein [Kutzneria kofuensis]MBB5894836.1 hypothetical protein [Kutzneria kofuensis]
MTCQRCGWDNPSNFLVCERCGAKRVIDLSGAGPAGPTSAASAPAGTAGFARDATRYLCAAVQLSPSLNDKALRGILHEQHRAIASSPGVDLVTVLKYGLAARQRHLLRDGLLGLILLIFLIMFLRSPLVAFGWIIPLGLGAWLTVFVESLVAHYGVVAAHLGRTTFDPAKAPEPDNPRDRRRLAEIGARDRGNVTVFAAYSPFVGYGQPAEKWSFTLNVAKPAEGKKVVPFAVQEVHDFVADDVRQLGLPGIVVEDRLFVNGLDLLHGFEPEVQQAVLPDELAAPVSRVDAALFSRLQENPKSRARPYLVVRIGGWSGQLVVTMFLRFALLPQKDMLFVEANYSLLPPMRQDYLVVDRLLGRPTWRQVSRVASVSLIKAVPALFGGFFRTVAVPLAALGRPGKLRREAREITQDRSFNYGAGQSLREQAADTRYHRYFQQLDREMYGKLAERRVMDALTRFLDDHNIDTSELVERTTMITNNGIYVTGEGKIDAKSIAVGANAVARTFNRVTQARGSGGQD